ncbi:hypothetical protein MFRU_020g00610 [Monilinia fructicola]|nr:hypothetical protein MFRU_020g00610 [Monilinia fructicola]
MDFIPHCSAAACTLTCKSLMCTFGDRYIGKRESFPSIEEYDIFLELLAFDMRSVVACSDCHTLHSMKAWCQGDGPYKGLLQNLTAGQDVLRDSPFVNTDSELSSREDTLLSGTTYAKMAMKRYHEDPKCTKVTDFISMPKPIICQVPGGLVQLTHEAFRVIKGSLMHRRQRIWTPLEQFSDSDFKDFDADHTAIGPSRLSICTHIRLPGKITVGGLIEKGRCGECRTEFSLGFKEIYGGRFALFITIWKDFGSSLEDDAWQQHQPLARPSEDIPWISASYDNQMVIYAPPPTIFYLVQTHPQLLELSSAFEDGRRYQYDSALTPIYQYGMFKYQWKHWCYNARIISKGKTPDKLEISEFSFRRLEKPQRPTPSVASLLKRWLARNKKKSVEKD